jgi:predicted proteasome-type protease
MTYCVGLRLNKGLVFMSDTRTNAGVDNVSVFRKMFSWQVPGERVLMLMTAGNLATTQAVVSLIDERSKAPHDRNPSILETPSMFQAAREIGETLREVIHANAMSGQTADSSFNATLILGGQIRGSEPRLFMIYPEGNFVEANRYAVLPDRRDQVWPADPGARIRSGHEFRGCGQADAGLLRFHHQGQSVGRPAARYPGLRGGFVTA